MIPEQLRSFCALCPAEAGSVPELVDHLARDHGLEVQRWPDGEPVVDMSDVPELMEER